MLCRVAFQRLGNAYSICFQHTQFLCQKYASGHDYFRLVYQIFLPLFRFLQGTLPRVGSQRCSSRPVGQDNYNLTTLITLFVMFQRENVHVYHKIYQNIAAIFYARRLTPSGFFTTLTVVTLCNNKFECFSYTTTCADSVNSICNMDIGTTCSL